LGGLRWQIKAGEFVRQHDAFLIGECRVLQTREGCRAVVTIRQSPDAVHQDLEIAPAALMRVAIPFDEALRACHFDRELIVSDREYLDVGEPALNARILDLVA
jgi:hypothetical protein